MITVTCAGCGALIARDPNGDWFDIGRRESDQLEDADECACPELSAHAGRLTVHRPTS